MPKEIVFDVCILGCNDQTFWNVYIKAQDTDKPVRTFYEECDSFNDALLEAVRALTAELARINARGMEKEFVLSLEPPYQLCLFD